MSIAIGITTTPERSGTFHACLRAWQLHLPEDATIFIYCDTNHESISISKNKVLAMCDYADHIFMVDDDIFPMVGDWHLPYVNSGLNHACYTFGRVIYNRTIQYISYDKPCGLMLYFRKICIDKVGGWDTDFKIWSYEHVDLSQRIFNIGLTPAPFIDIPNSHGLFYSYDEHQAIESSVQVNDRMMGIQINTPLLESKRFSKEFKAYK